MTHNITTRFTWRIGLLLALALPVSAALAQWGHPPGYSASRFAAHSHQRPPALIKDITPQGYRLRIPLRDGQQAEEIRLQTQGRTLLISSRHQHYRASEQQDAQGRALHRGVRFSSGSFRRRIALPPDAQPEAMQRSDQQDAVVVIFPRR